MSNAGDPFKPVETQLPETNASPIHLTPRVPHDVQWYRPGWDEVAGMLGWRWIFFIPLAALTVLVLLSPLRPWLLLIPLMFLLPLIVFIAYPMVIAREAGNRIIRLRRRPFCIHCGYDLAGLPDQHDCPECGESYSFALCAEYQRNPDWFITRYEKRANIPAPDAPFQAQPSTKARSRDGT